MLLYAEEIQEKGLCPILVLVAHDALYLIVTRPVEVYGIVAYM
jgi:hypothetical protein